MEPKKTKKADLEWKKPTFFQIGLFASLLLVFLAFEYVGASYINPILSWETTLAPEDDIIIPTEPPKDPPAPTPQDLIPTALKLVSNDVDVSDHDFNQDIKENDDFGDLIVDIPESKPEPVGQEPPFVLVEVEPKFPGGDIARIKFFNDHIVYPRPAREAGVQGEVVVEFIVETDGSISNVRVLREQAPLLDEEAVRVTKMMPKWEPGKQRGKTVRVQYRMPVKFTLYD